MFMNWNNLLSECSE